MTHLLLSATGVFSVYTT